MQQYLSVVRAILENGQVRTDRTGTGTIGLFALPMTFDLRDGFPLLTARRMWWRGIIGELLWFVSGSTTVGDLPPDLQKIWTPWADQHGELGPIYGQQLRGGLVDVGVSQPTTIRLPDQLQQTIHNLRTDPTSRRHVITLWSPICLPDQRLPCCHGTVIQFYLDNDRRLHCATYQRSADVFIGLPWNIASYALLLHMIANCLQVNVGTLTYIVGDAHIYRNHIEQSKLLLSREPRELPRLLIRAPEVPASIDTHTVDDFELVGYAPHPAIDAEIAV